MTKITDAHIHIIYSWACYENISFIIIIAMTYTLWKMNKLNHDNQRYHMHTMSTSVDVVYSFNLLQLMILYTFFSIFCLYSLIFSSGSLLFDVNFTAFLKAICSWYDLDRPSPPFVYSSTLDNVWILITQIALNDGKRLLNYLFLLAFEISHLLHSVHLLP